MEEWLKIALNRKKMIKEKNLRISEIKKIRKSKIKANTFFFSS